MLFLHTFIPLGLFVCLDLFHFLRQGFILYPTLSPNSWQSPVSAHPLLSHISAIVPGYTGFGQALLFDWKSPSQDHAAQLLFSLQCQFLSDLFLRAPIRELSLSGPKAVDQLLGSLPAPCWVYGTEGFLTLGVWSSLPQLYSCWDLDRYWFNWIIVAESREQPSPSQLFFQSDV